MKSITACSVTSKNWQIPKNTAIRTILRSISKIKVVTFVLLPMIICSCGANINIDGFDNLKKISDDIVEIADSIEQESSDSNVSNEKNRIPGYVVSAVEMYFFERGLSEYGSFIRVIEARKTQTNPATSEDLWIGTYEFKLFNGTVSSDGFGVWAREW